MKDLRSGTMEPRPPIRIAMEEMLAKPHRAKVTMALLDSLRV